MSTISLVLILFCVVVIVVGIYEIHSLPGEIARKRGHPQFEAITVCSILGLLIFPLWMFALVWAYAGVVGTPYARPGAGGSTDAGATSATAATDVPGTHTSDDAADAEA